VSVQQQHRAMVVAEALTWLGTPYHHHARLKGLGVDCAQILCAVYEACGVVHPVDPGDYPHDHHLHSRHELYIEWPQRAGAREVQTPGLGDVALFQFGRTWSHGGILVAPGQVLHAMQDARRVVLTRLDEYPLAGRAPRWWSLWRTEA
jgi:cell wall-associated NlpC family hydrolase